jgi:hypothetical protein
MIANQQATAVMAEPRTGPSASMIAVEAYYLWRARSGEYGSAEGDWLSAEARLLGLA